METSFCELKGKEVINIVDGKKLGRIIDMVFETCNGRILGIVVPAYNKSWNIFKASEDIFIPYNCICKFGDDAILVRIFVAEAKQSKKRGKFAKTAIMPDNSNINNQQNGAPINNNLKIQGNNSQLNSYQNDYEEFYQNNEAKQNNKHNENETNNNIPLYSA